MGLLDAKDRAGPHDLAAYPFGAMELSFGSKKRFGEGLQVAQLTIMEQNAKKKHMVDEEGA